MYILSHSIIILCYILNYYSVSKINRIIIISKKGKNNYNFIFFTVIYKNEFYIEFIYQIINIYILN